MFTEICLFNSYNLLIGYTISWESCRTYLLYLICYENFDILIDLHLQNWLNISLF